MNVYISCHDRELARPVAEAVRRAGHLVTSSYLDAEGHPTTPEERFAAAERNLAEIIESQVLVLVSGPEGTPCDGGKFVEAGFALALPIPVICLHRRENLLLHAEDVFLAESLPDLLLHLDAAAALIAPDEEDDYDFDDLDLDYFDEDDDLDDDLDPTFD